MYISNDAKIIAYADDIYIMCSLTGSTTIDSVYQNSKNKKK